MAISAAALDQLAKLRNHNEDNRAEQADAPLLAGQVDSVEDALQRGQAGDQEGEDERGPDQLDEPAVRNRVALEDRPRRLPRLSPPYLSTKIFSDDRFESHE